MPWATMLHVQGWQSSSLLHLIAYHALLKRKEKAMPVGDHNGSLCMETVAARDYGHQGIPSVVIAYVKGYMHCCCNWLAQ